MLTLVLLLLAALGVWTFFALFESYQEEIPTGYTNEARINPFFAAQVFMQKNDVSVISDPNQLDFTSLDSDVTVFLSSVDSVILTDKQVSQALTWIFSGGYLVVGVGQEISGHASLLSSFDITPEWVENPNEFANFFDDELSEDEEAELAGEAALRGVISLDSLREMLEHEPLTFKLELTDVEQSLDVQVLDNISLQHPSQEYDEEGELLDYQPTSDYEVGAVAADEYGIRLLQVAYGEGIFTALSSDEMWRNEHIGAVDHAFFLNYLAPNDTSLLIYYNINSPSLFSLLRKYFWETMMALCVLLLLWLWRSVQRVEGIEAVEVGNRRLFSEHLIASAKFLFSHEQYTQLLEPLKDEINQLAAKWYPAFNALSDQEQANLMAQRTDLPASRISQWQRVMRDCQTQSNFETALRLGNHIREAYERHI
jgi:hypothetical protein